METSANPNSLERLALPPSLIVHGIVMVVLALFINVAQYVLWLCAVVQFLWMLILRQRNTALAEFGRGLANWMANSSRFMTGASDLRPFPWSPWGRA